MASNIFNLLDCEQLIARIDALKVNNQRRWGTMNLNQMLEHCNIQLQLGLGKIESSKYEGSTIMRTSFGRWLLLYVTPWPKGLPTPSKMNAVKNALNSEEFDSEKKQLLLLLGEVQQSSHLKPHPFFGAMNQKDWGRLIWKHLDHHLRQFGG